MGFPFLPALYGGAALGGGLMSLLGRKRPAQTTQLQRFTPEQQKLINQIGPMALQGMQNPMEGFEPIAQQEINRFQQSTVPTLAERFTSLGAGGQRSSAFQGALGRAGAGLGQNLAAMGSQYGLQRMGQLQNLLGMGLTPQFENIYQPERMGAMQRMGGELMSGGLQSLFSGFAQKQQSDDASERLEKILEFLRSTQNNKQNTESVGSGFGSRFGSGFGSRMENLLYSGFRG